MTCSACSARVEQAVRKLAGTEEVSVNLLTNSLQLRYDEQQTNPAAIIAAIEAAGYGASVKGAQAKRAAAAPAEDPLQRHAEEMRRRLIWSVAFLLPTLYISMHGLFAQLFGLPVPALVLLYAVDASPLGAVAIILAGGLVIGTLGISIVLAQRYLPSRVALASGLSIGFSIGIGGLLTIIMGRIADVYGYETAFLTVAGVALVAALLVLLLPSDRRAATG